MRDHPAHASRRQFAAEHREIMVGRSEQHGQRAVGVIAAMAAAAAPALPLDRKRTMRGTRSREILLPEFQAAACAVVGAAALRDAQFHAADLSRNGLRQVRKFQSRMRLNGDTRPRT